MAIGISSGADKSSIRTFHNIRKVSCRPSSLKEKLIKIGAKVISHGRYVAFQMAEVALLRQMFQEIRLIAELRAFTDMKRSMVMRSSATDRRSAFKCQGKRPDQPRDNRSGCPR